MRQIFPANGHAEGLRAADLVDIFNQLFLGTHNTELVGGGIEPIYQPMQPPNQHHRIVFTRDYGASALHEIAHWCVAGEERRQLEDYGYWYCPDGRSEVQQRQFEVVEIKPQAFEWIFSVASSRRFRVSADNLTAGVSASEQFKDAIYEQVLEYCITGLPKRAARFTQALAQCSGVVAPLSPEHYQRIVLD